MTVIRRLDRALGAVLRAFAVTCLVALLVILAGNVVARYLQLFSLGWYDEVVEGLFAWMVFLGTAALWRESDHFRVDWLAGHLHRPGARRAQRITVSALSLAFLVLMTWTGWQLALRSGAETPVLKLPTAVFYLCIPVAGALMAAYSLADLWRALAGRPASGDA